MAVHTNTGGREAPEVLTPVKARQGFLDRPVLAVLLISIGLVVVGFGGLFFGFW